MRTDLFDYPLPEALIAQQPLERRDASRLMTVDRATGAIGHRRFHELPMLLAPGDVLVVNNSRVISGRLEACKQGTGGAVELLLLEQAGPGCWRALAGGARLHRGSVLELGDGSLLGEVVNGPAGGRVVVRFELARGEGPADEALLRLGAVPLPPYIKQAIANPERYQTVYAEREISAAAPTAGLHFTRELLDELVADGISLGELELAVGMDTFVPVREETVEEHHIHSEWYSVPEACARLVNGAAGRVVAVGTTVVRALESAAAEDGGERVTPQAERTGLFITPGYRFRAVDAMVTNFHFPRSTLLMLVCAFGGRELILAAYAEAVRERYRFYSFGDAMLIT